MDSYWIGQYGERVAARYLFEHGYRILSAQFKTKFGELDIVAEDKKYVAIVEVKTRSDGMIYAPADAVDYKKRKKIIAAAKFYVSKYEIQRQLRFDVIEVFMNNDKPYKINHILNAFDANGD